MGCHIDGFIAIVAHTHVLQEGPITGRAADVIAAANTAAEVALRLVKPGKSVSYLRISVNFYIFRDGVVLCEIWSRMYCAITINIYNCDDV